MLHLNNNDIERKDSSEKLPNLHCFVIMLKNGVILNSLAPEISLKHLTRKALNNAPKGVLDIANEYKAPLS